MHRRLSRAIQIQQPRTIAVTLKPRRQPGRLQRLTGEDDRLQTQLPRQLRRQRVGSLQRIKRRRGLAQHRHLLSDQQRVEILRRTRHRLRHHHQPATREQRTPDLTHRDVEGQRMPQRPHLPRRDLRRQRTQQTHHIAVRDPHTLRHPRGTRGVDDVGHIAGIRNRQHRHRLPGKGLVVDVDDDQIPARQLIRQRRSGNRRRRRRILEDELHPRRRHRRIDRHIRRPRLQHTQDRHHRISATRGQQRHPLTAPHPLRRQQVRHPIRRLIQLPVAHRATLKAHRQRLRRRRHLRSEHRRNRLRYRLRPGQCRAVGPLVEMRKLLLMGRLDRGQSPRWVGGHRHQHLLQARGQIGQGNAGERLGGTQRAQKEVVADAGEDEPEAADEARVGHLRGCLDTTEVKGEGVREEIDHHSVGIADVSLAFQFVNRKPLMCNGFANPCVDVAAEVGDGRSRRDLEHQWDDAGDHPRQCLGFGSHPSAHREVEHDLGTLGAPFAHQQRARRGNDRSSRHVPHVGQVSDPAKDHGIQSHRLGTEVGIVLPGGLNRTTALVPLRRQVLCPVRLIVLVVRGGFVVRLEVDQILQ